jgi:hypothetical protein
MNIIIYCPALRTRRIFLFPLFLEAPYVSALNNVNTVRRIPYCKTFGMKYVREEAICKKYTTSETVDFHKYELGAIAAIHSLPGICTVHC